MQRLNTDLETAVAFVIEQISKEGVRSAAPLDDDEKYFLRHLPKKPTNPSLQGAPGDCDGSSLPVLRDFAYERLCTLAKNASLRDAETRSGAEREWEFAAAVLQLEHHPMSWLLSWAGIRTRKQRVWWDRSLLVGTALLVVLVFLVGAIALSVLAEGQMEVWKRTLWVGGGCVCAAILAFLYFAVQRLEDRQLKRTVERYRSALLASSSGGPNH